MIKSESYMQCVFKIRPKMYGRTVRCARTSFLVSSFKISHRGRIKYQQKHCNLRNLEEDTIHTYINSHNFPRRLGRDEMLHFNCRGAAGGGGMFGDVNISAILDSFSISYDKRVRPNYGGELFLLIFLNSMLR